MEYGSALAPTLKDGRLHELGLRLGGAFTGPWQYLKVVIALNETIRLMEEIDVAISKWSIE